MINLSSFNIKWLITIIPFQGVLTYPRYLVNLTFSGLEIVDKHFNIEDIVFTISTYNPQFTHVEIWFR